MASAHDPRFKSIEQQLTKLSAAIAEQSGGKQGDKSKEAAKAACRKAEASAAGAFAEVIQLLTVQDAANVLATIITLAADRRLKTVVWYVFRRCELSEPRASMVFAPWG